MGKCARVTKWGVGGVQRIEGWIGRKDRDSLVLDAVVHRTDGSKSPVRLTNFSDEGCRIQADGAGALRTAGALVVVMGNSSESEAGGMVVDSIIVLTTIASTTIS